MGITPEDQQRLFTRFFRTTAAAHIQGTGLGLSITKAIVDAHNGSISVTSEPGHGTSFTVTIPTAEPLVGEQQTPAGRSRRGNRLDAARAQKNANG